MRGRALDAARTGRSTRSASPPRRRSRCRWSSAGSRSGCSSRSAARRRRATTSGCCRLRRQRRDGRRDRAHASRSSGCARPCAPPRRNAGAGRASCTTTRCRGSAACGCCWSAAARGDDPERLRAAVDEAVARHRGGDRRAARTDPRAAPGRPRRARPRRRDRRASPRAPTDDGTDRGHRGVQAPARRATRPSWRPRIYRIVQEALDQRGLSRATPPARADHRSTRAPT